MIRIYVLKAWVRNTVYPDQGEWINKKITFNEQEAEWWIESPMRTWAGEGPDPNADYDVFEVDTVEDFHIPVEVEANNYAKEIGATEPDWRRKQVVADFTKGFDFAVNKLIKQDQ